MPAEHPVLSLAPAYASRCNRATVALKIGFGEKKFFVEERALMTFATQDKKGRTL
jgi:hypothetical protein